MTPQMMVLGLVAEEAGTVADVQRRLSGIFRSAAFPPNSAHSSLPTLVKKGYVRLIDHSGESSGDPYEVRLVGEGSDDYRVYEVTRAGLKHIREWVRSSPPPPAMREAIHGKIEFATLDELAEVMVMVRAEARECQLVSDEAHERMLSEQRNRVVRRKERRGWAETLDDELSDAHLADITLMWDDIAARRRKLGERLEEIHKRASRVG
jgi:hypothetical protein